jgi:hypothetical protein
VCECVCAYRVFVVLEELVTTNIHS